MDGFEKGGDNTSLMVECKVIYPQDTENSIYLKSYSRSTKVRVLNSENLINRLRDGEEIIAYGIKNPETSKEEKATTKGDGEDVFRIDFYKKIDMPKIFARFWLKKEDEKLEEELGLTFPRGNFESVGGFIIHLLGRIPEVNEKVQYKELEMTIEQADQRKIDKIIIRCMGGQDLTKKKPVLQIDSNSEPDKRSLKTQI